MRSYVPLITHESGAGVVIVDKSGPGDHPESVTMTIAIPGHDWWQVHTSAVEVAAFCQALMAAAEAK